MAGKFLGSFWVMGLAGDGGFWLYPSEQRTLLGSLISWWTGVMSEAGAVRRRRSRIEVEKLVAEFEASG